MNIVIISSFDRKGGAAIASSRTRDMFINAGHDVEMVVAESQIKNGQSVSSGSLIKKYLWKASFILEKVVHLFYEKNKEVRWQFSHSKFGIDISNEPEILKADLINIHWIGHSFVSLHSLEKIIALNKPIVITLHDMWFFTGGCHYSNGCLNFQESCGNCFQYLAKPSQFDLSYKNWKNKFDAFKESKVLVHAPSHWLTSLAKTSSIFESVNCFTIPNPINTAKFLPSYNKVKSKSSFGIDEKLYTITFIADRISDSRKGFSILLEALKKMNEMDEKLCSNIKLLVVGNQKDELNVPFKTLNLGYVASEEKMIEIYQATDVFILPSLQDNLPNTMVEAMACGVPCVAFNLGGMPDIIKDGYNGKLINDVGNSNHFAEAIIDTLEHLEVYQKNAKLTADQKLSFHAVSTLWNQKLNVFKL